jgi:hypothetical protein
MLMGLAVIAMPLACGTTVKPGTSTTSGGNGGAGGVGGAGPTSVSSPAGSGGYNTSNVASTYGTGPSSSTGPATCDTLKPGNSGDQVCKDCIQCAQTYFCAAQVAQLNTQDFTDWSACVYGSNVAKPCPPDDPNTPEDEHQVCVDNCNMSHPGEQALYLAALQCVVCSSCNVNCNSDAAFGDCTMLPPAP